MLKKFTLLRSQRSRVFELLQEGQLEPAEFSWAKEEIVGSILVSRLNYREGTYYFQFSSHELNAWCVACPGRFRSMDYEYPKDWQEQEGVFRNWTKFLKREVEFPDYWGEMAKYQAAVGVEPADTVVNEPISACEADDIGRVLTRLGERVGQELKLEGEAVSLVRGKFAYLAEAARRQRSRDWVYTALGVCATTAMALSLSQDGAAALWALLRNEVGRILHFKEVSRVVHFTQGTRAAVGLASLKPVF
jgi:hypothetical protein